MEEYLDYLGNETFVNLIIFKKELRKSLETKEKLKWNSDDIEKTLNHLNKFEEIISQKVDKITWDIKIEPNKLIEDFGFNYLHPNLN